jgi:hypothetical protein
VSVVGLHIESVKKDQPSFIKVGCALVKRKIKIEINKAIIANAKTRKEL